MQKETISYTFCIMDGMNLYREALMQNYEKMASLAAENKAVVIRGTHRVHFEDQVLSWHHINGQNAEEILLAI